MDDHDILTGLVKEVSWIKNNLGNHIKHHWMLEIALIALLAATVISKIWS